MKNKTLVIVFICSLFMASTPSISFAGVAECDIGPIRNARILIDGTWYIRPDASIDQQPSTTSTGPFEIRADLVDPSWNIAYVELRYSTDGTNYAIVDTEIVNNTIIGVIQQSSKSTAFYLEGFDENGGGVWLDEIHNDCDNPTAAGDPYNFIIVGPLVETIQIDIKPSSFPNCLNINGHGVIPVAILGSEDLDVTSIDTSTLRFAGLEVRVRGNKGPLCHIEDVSGDFTYPEGAPDGYLDLVCQFEDDPDAWESGDGEGILNGELFDETPIEGSDSICIKPE
jgi:hypothetical protein